MHCYGCCCSSQCCCSYCCCLQTLICSTCSVRPLHTRQTATVRHRPLPPPLLQVLFTQLDSQQELLEQAVCRASKAEAEAELLRRELAEAHRVAKRASGQASALHRQLSDGQLYGGQMSSSEATRRLADARSLLEDQQRAAAAAAIHLAELQQGLADPEAASRAAAAATELAALQGSQTRLAALLEEGRHGSKGAVVRTRWVLQCALLHLSACITSGPPIAAYPPPSLPAGAPAGPCRRLWLGRVTCKPSEEQVLEVVAPFGTVTSGGRMGPRWQRST